MLDINFAPNEGQPQTAAAPQARNALSGAFIGRKAGHAKGAFFFTPESVSVFRGGEDCRNPVRRNSGSRSRL